MSNLTRYTMEHGKYAGLPYINEVPHPAGEYVKFDDIKELLNTAHNTQSKQCQCTNSCVSTIYVCKDCGGRVNSKR